MTDTDPLVEAPAPETIQDPTTKIETPQPETVEAPEPKAETPEPPETPEEAERKRPSGSQRLKRQLTRIESDYASLAQENEQLRQLVQQRPQPQNEGQPGVDREPREQDFPNDYFAFQSAQTAWNARQAIRAEFDRLRNQDRQTNATRAQIEWRTERMEAYEDSAAQVRERIPDFDKVVQAASSVAVSPELAEEVLASDKAALLQYHLAQNPGKVRELNGLKGRELAREIGRLEAKVHLPTPKKATEASPPPSEIRGGAAPPVDTQSGPDDMNAYVKWRRKQKADA